MHVVENVVRKIKGEEKVLKFAFGSGRLTGNPPGIQEFKGYKVMRGFGFSIRFSNGKDNKPTFYPLVLWGKNAELMARLGFEGQLVELSGRIVKEHYKKNGEEKEIEKLVVERFTVLEYKNNSVNNSSNEYNGQDNENTSSNNGSQDVEENEEMPNDIEEIDMEEEFDDLPF